MREREDQLRTAVMRLIREDPLLIEDVQRAQDLLAVLEGRPDFRAKYGDRGYQVRR